MIKNTNLNIISSYPFICKRCGRQSYETQLICDENDFCICKIGYGCNIMREKNCSKKSIKVVVSGGFDPLHIGHVRMINEAKTFGDELIVILNNDNWLKQKKGFVFMPELERKEVLESLRCVDRVLLSNHLLNSKDMSVCEEVEYICPDIFVNGGDRVPDNTPEIDLCRRIGCKMFFNVGKGGKIQSSSLLVNKFIEEKK